MPAAGMGGGQRSHWPAPIFTRLPPARAQRASCAGVTCGLQGPALDFRERHWVFIPCNPKSGLANNGFELAARP